MATISMGRVVARRAIPQILLPSRGSNGAPHISFLARAFSASVYDSQDLDQTMANSRAPVTSFSEDEEMVRNMARQWANEELRPLVRDMDNECKTRPEIIEGLFECGFMGMVRLVFKLKMIPQNKFVK